jgi:hypothetical protein
MADAIQPNCSRAPSLCINNGEGRCIWCGQAVGERARLPTPVENLVPLELRRALNVDATVNAIVRNACYNNHTREQALIDMVVALVEDKERLLRALSDAELRRPNVIHLDGDATMLVQKEPTDG